VKPHELVDTRYLDEMNKSGFILGRKEIISMPEPLRELGQGIPDSSGKYRIAQLCAALARCFCLIASMPIFLPFTASASASRLRIHVKTAWCVSTDQPTSVRNRRMVERFLQQLQIIAAQRNQARVGL
jgi:hypothetical protein